MRSKKAQRAAEKCERIVIARVAAPPLGQNQGRQCAEADAP